MILRNNFDLTEFNSYKIKSKVILAIFPQNKQEISEALMSYQDSIIIGGGNNIILSKSIYEKPMIFIRDNFSTYKVDGYSIIVDSGLSMCSLSKIAAENSLKGLEYFYDIPGTVGGGIAMNAGSENCLISDYLIEVEVFNKKERKFNLLNKNQCEFRYRESIFNNNNLVIVGAEFSFPYGDKTHIYELMTEIRKKREVKQPKNFPNAGSVFKRPKGYYVGEIIQELGLKGYTIGGAQISEKHAGFIINRGGATGEEIIYLINYIKSMALSKLNIHLTLEQIII